MKRDIALKLVNDFIVDFKHTFKDGERIRSLGIPLYSAYTYLLKVNRKNTKKGVKCVLLLILNLLLTLNK